MEERGAGSPKKEVDCEGATLSWTVVEGRVFGNMGIKLLFRFKEGETEVKGGACKALIRRDKARAD